MQNAKRFVARALRKIARILDPLVRDVRPQVPRECPICGYSGWFGAFGVAPRPDSMCPNCGSGERHRLFKLVIDRHDPIPDGARVLHFAPEVMLTQLVRPGCSEYVQCDIEPSRADVVADIERLPFDARSFDVVICLHVLEHVDDRKALSEIHRVLSDDGVALLMVPIAEGWDGTYEDPEIRDDAERIAHFGQVDHVRYYGADFGDRVRQAGFDVQGISTTGLECARYGLIRGEKVFLARKPATGENEALRSGEKAGTARLGAATGGEAR